MSIEKIVVLALLPLALTGCGGSTPAAAPAPVVTVTATSTPTPTPTPTETETPVRDELDPADCVDEPDALLLSEAWVLADASRGASDHQKYVTAFAENTNSLAKKLSDQCPGDLTLSIAKMNMDAAILNAEVLAADGDEGHDQTYSDIKADGKEFFRSAGVTDHKFGKSLFDE